MSPIAVDAYGLYWVDSLHTSGGPVARLALTGGTSVGVTTVTYWGQVIGTGGGGIVLDTTNVYWLDFMGNVTKLALAGGTPVNFAPGRTGGSITRGIAVDATSVYYAAQVPGTSSPSGGLSIMKVAK